MLKSFAKSSSILAAGLSLAAGLAWADVAISCEPASDDATTSFTTIERDGSIPMVNR